MRMPLGAPIAPIRMATAKKTAKKAKSRWPVSISERMASSWSRRFLYR
jgi:hypothetical protein